MKSVLILVLSSTYVSYALSLTDPRNKTKRNLSSEVHGYGEPNGVWLYTDNFKPPAIRTPENFAPLPKPLALVGLQPVKVFEPKVAAQQVVYEYQQNPSSNVQVKQVFQPENNFHNPSPGEYKPAPVNASPNPGNLPSETIVSPVQHSHMIQHPSQPIVNPRIHPLYNVQASYSVQHQPPYYNVQQPTYNVPRKYAYVNGRLIYDPSTFQLQQQPVGGLYQVNQPQVLPRQPVVNYHNNHLPKPNLIPPPVPQSKFSPPAKHLIQTVDTPSQSPLSRESEDKKKHEEKPVREKEEAEDEDNDKENHEEEDDSSDEHFDRLRFDDEDDHSDFRSEEDEDDDGPERYEEEEEEDDNNKRGSKYVISKYKKQPKKKYNPGKERSYYYSGKFDYPDEKPSKKGGRNKQKMHYKSVKYSKDSRDPVEGRYSENVPVFHKKKVFKEKWYVSKSHNDD